MDLKDEYFPISELPNEVLEVVLRKLTQREAISLRSVNKDFKTKVDSLFDLWVIRLDDNCPYLELSLGFRVKSIKIQKPITQLSLGEPRLFFAYPDHISKLTLLNNFEGDRHQLSPSNLDILLKLANLKDISLKLRAPLLNSPFFIDNPLGYTFLKLEKLEIVLDIAGQILEDNLFHKILGRSSFPKLTDLTITFITEDRAALLEVGIPQTIIRFLGSQGPVLKKLLYNLYTFTEVYLDEDSLSLKDLEVVKNCSTLKSVELNTPDQHVLSGTWERLLKCQCKLENLDLGCEVTVCTELLEHIVLRNFRTLTVISILGLDCTTKILDMAVFRECQGLKELALQVFGGNIWLPGREYLEAEDEDRTRAVNLASLPESLKNISLEGYMLESDDVIGFLNKCADLEVLLFFFPRGRVSYGINGTCFGTMVRHPKLQSLKLSNKNAINCSTPEEMRIMMDVLSSLGVDILENMVAEFFEWYFQGLQRKLESDNPGWKLVGLQLRNSEV